MYTHFGTSNYSVEKNDYDLFKWPLSKNEEIYLLILGGWLGGGDRGLFKNQSCLE